MIGVKTGVAVLASTVILASSSTSHAFSGGITTLSFGPSGCNQCHSGGMAPTVTLSGPTTVGAGSQSEYTLQIAHMGAGQTFGGLNVSAGDGALATGGSDSANTQTLTGSGGRDEVTHTSRKAAVSGVTTFTFLWTAPVVDGMVTLSAWGNSVNGNGASSGDQASFTSLAVQVSGAGPTPTPTPVPEGPCSEDPLAGCLQPGKALLFIKELSPDSKDQLLWKWDKGEATDALDFGDPESATSYTWCLYEDPDGNGSQPSSLLLALEVPPGGVCAGKPCWKALGDKGFKYKDKELMSDGASQLLLKAGDEGKAKVLLKGKGDNLPFPVPFLAFSPNAVITAQLVNDELTCWETSHSPPFTKNQVDQFKDD
jgi:hypothetical protein